MLLYMKVKNLIYFSVGQGPLEDHLDEFIQKLELLQIWLPHL